MHCISSVGRFFALQGEKTTDKREKYHAAGSPEPASPELAEGSKGMLEIERVDVRFIEHSRLAEQHGAILVDCVIAQLAGGELIAGLALDLAGGDCVQR